MAYPRFEKKLKRARKRIRKLKRGVETPEIRWARQREQLAGVRPDGLVDLAYFPGGTWNDYARLLYSRCPEYGFLPRSLPNVAAVGELSPDAVFHLHWTRAAQVGSANRVAAEQKTASFLAPIEAFVDRGGTFVWTIHEPIDHDASFPDLEIGLRTRLAELAHGIHILHSSAMEALTPLYPVDPAKVFVVEHPLYTGVYPDYIGRPAARASLGLAPDQPMLLGFGAIRPYKGFERLVGALPLIRAETGSEVRLMIAGRALRNIATTELRDLVSATPGATMTAEGPPETAVAPLFRAADLVVLPYRYLHNSGVLFLALTFGVPVVVPSSPVADDLADSGLVHQFAGESSDDLVAVTVAALRSGGGRSLPSDLVNRFDPQRLGGVFAEHLRSLLAGKVP